MPETEHAVNSPNLQACKPFNKAPALVQQLALVRCRVTLSQLKEGNNSLPEVEVDIRYIRAICFLSIFVHTYAIGIFMVRSAHDSLGDVKVH